MSYDLKKSVIIKKPASNEAPASLVGQVERKGLSLVGNRMPRMPLRRGFRSRRSGRGRRQGRSNPMAKNRLQPPSLPPEIEATPIVGHTFRFRNLSDLTTLSITAGNLIGICGVVGTVTNTTAVSVASAVKLRRVTIWPSSEAESATDHNPEISFASSTYGTVGDRSYNRSVPGGISVSAPLRATPKPDTLSALWQNSSTTSSVLFTLYDIPKNSIIDVDVSFCLRNSQNGVSYSVATAVIGTMYYLYLDGSTASCIPVALPNTH